MESNQSVFSTLPIELSALILSEARNPYTSLVSKEFNTYSEETNKIVLLNLLKYIPEELFSPSNLRITKKIEKKLFKGNHSNTVLLNLLYKKLLNAANIPFVPLQRDFSEGIISVACRVCERDIISDDNLMKIWNRVLVSCLDVTDVKLKTADEVRDWLNQNKDRVNKVTHLTLNNLKLTCLPREICKFSGLESLYIDENILISLPPEIGKLTSLQTLRCTENRLTTLPDQIRKLSKLKALHASENHITCLPESIGFISSLVELTLHNNRLSQVPNSLGKLSKLRLLRLDRNLLKNLPSELGNLSSLRAFLVNRNKLVSIPSEIGSLSSLKRLCLNENKLTTLPSELGNLSLSEFDIKDNPFDILPLELRKFSAILEK